MLYRISVRFEEPREPHEYRDQLGPANVHTVNADSLEDALDEFLEGFPFDVLDVTERPDENAAEIIAA